MRYDYRSPNFGERKAGALPSLIVLHYTAMHSAEGALKVLCSPESEVSAHYLIDELGVVYSLVDEENRAWHAGAGSWGQITDVNSHSIGIELSNSGFQPFSMLQMDSLCVLLQGIMARHSLTPQAVIGHSDLAPGRKIDPGARFDWKRLAREGLTLWPRDHRAASCCFEQPHSNSIPSGGVARSQSLAVIPPEFWTMMAQLGYRTDVDAKILLHCFRLRFRPHIARLGDDVPFLGDDLEVLAAVCDAFIIDGAVVSP